ncbi:hypothetical protein P171DRAFT_314280, partial [Karstenula rhodostoma CBS 690.94]
MSLKIVPYNNAMRLGQGFNSYTQQICIDDAVVIDPDRAENVITNDGTTMRILADKNAQPSVWNRQPEIVNDDPEPTQTAPKATTASGATAVEQGAEKPTVTGPASSAEDREEAKKMREDQRKLAEIRREEMRKAIKEAADTKATPLEQLKKIAAQNQFADRFTGILEPKSEYVFDPNGARGPSQTVSYTSRFVDRLSDVTEDLCVSGSLSIKAGKIGGSGKGSFVDSDKFKQSDLNFYISVKVVNQTINFKDALVYNPVRSIKEGDPKAGDKFKKIFGDSFIAGFIEGGEFNALVSMKILNKAKKTDIQAEAKVALTVGPVDLEAQANVGIARSNLETNTETTIQVSWSGGGHIKPMEQQWDISSLMQAAARFPDLVADCPQRTYAILGRYETLRSFVAKAPVECTPLQYENAQIYTNTLLDSFMSYKAMYKTIGENIFAIQGKTLEIKKHPETGLFPYKEDLYRFEDSIKGLSDARIAIRRQMARIVNEVDLIELNPKLATDEDHHEPFQSPLAFETRLPVVEIPAKFRPRANPLTGASMAPPTLTPEEAAKQEQEEQAALNAAPLYGSGVTLAPEEATVFETMRSTRRGISGVMRVTSPAGSQTNGLFFNNLDILQPLTVPEWVVRKFLVHVYNGYVCYIGTFYDNGLLIEKGVVSGFTVKHDHDGTSFPFGPFDVGERITSASVETGVRSTDHDNQPRVTAIGLFSNRGRSLVATAQTEARGQGTYLKDGVLYNTIHITNVEVPLERGTVKGFFGRSNDDQDGCIWRLGLLW